MSNPSPNPSPNPASKPPSNAPFFMVIALLSLILGGFIFWQSKQMSVIPKNPAPVSQNNSSSKP
jgi:hypothetical protein